MLNLFGDKKPSPEGLIKQLLSEILEGGGFSLSFQIKTKDDTGKIFVDVFGEDEGLLKEKEGRLLLALQSYVLRVLYKNFPDEDFRLFLDSNGFWEEKQSELMDLVKHLMKKALESNKPVSIKKTLSANQRRLIHEHVSGNTGLRSESLGEGPYKTMRLIPDTYRNDQ